MRKFFSKRIIFGLCCALLASFFLAAVGEAGPPQFQGPVRDDCQKCHESVVLNWQQSAHGLAVVDPIFQEAWQEAGSPTECLACHTTNYDLETGSWESDGIACGTCHSGQTGPHPETPMPTDPSSRLCGTCHVDTHAEWEVSAHGEGEMACVRCHNPHTTSLRGGGINELCTVCHTDEGHFYQYTMHAQQDLLCTDCHLEVSNSPMGEGHGKRVHTFAVSLETCNQCHSQEMHLPDPDASTTAVQGTGALLMWTGAEPNPNTTETCEYIGEPIVAEQPPASPTQPYHYLLVAAVGMGFGVAVTPVAEGWLRRRNSKD